MRLGGREQAASRTWPGAEGPWDVLLCCWGAPCRVSPPLPPHWRPPLPLAGSSLQVESPVPWSQELRAAWGLQGPHLGVWGARLVIQGAVGGAWASGFQENSEKPATGGITLSCRLRMSSQPLLASGRQTEEQRKPISLDVKVIALLHSGKMKHKKNAASWVSLKVSIDGAALMSFPFSEPERLEKAFT